MAVVKLNCAVLQLIKYKNAKNIIYKKIKKKKKEQKKNYFENYLQIISSFPASIEEGIKVLKKSISLNA